MLESKIDTAKKSKVKSSEELLEEYRIEFIEKFPFKPEEVSKEDYLKMVEEYVDERYWGEHDAWQDRIRPSA